VERVKIVRLIGDTRHEVELPLARAQELGIARDNRGALSLAYLMDGVLAWGHAGPAAQMACPVCGTTHRDVILRHSVGCATCYEVFGASIERILRVRTSGSTHRGRIPRRLLRYRALFIEREALMGQLRMAVEAEDFERAASLRDQISTIVKEPESRYPDGSA
jgi:protein arginine kinase activator